MPKSKKRQRGIGSGSTAQVRGTSGHRSGAPSQKSSVSPTPPRGHDKAGLYGRRIGPQSLLFPAMVALGCWGMAFSFFFLYNDPNHLLFGGMAVLMALIWTFSVSLRIRKLLALRQKS